MAVSWIIFLIVGNCNSTHPITDPRYISSLTSIFSRLPRFVKFTTHMFPRSLYRCYLCSSLSHLDCLKSQLVFLSSVSTQTNTPSLCLDEFSRVLRGPCFHMVCNYTWFLIGSVSGQITNSILWQTFFIPCSHMHLTPGKQIW